MAADRTSTADPDPAPPPGASPPAAHPEATTRALTLPDLFVRCSDLTRADLDRAADVPQLWSAELGDHADRLMRTWRGTELGDLLERHWRATSTLVEDAAVAALRDDDVSRMAELLAEHGSTQVARHEALEALATPALSLTQLAVIGVLAQRCGEPVGDALLAPWYAWWAGAHPRPAAADAAAGAERAGVGVDVD